MAANEYKALMRRKLLSDIYDKMDDRERLALMVMSMQDASHRETMNALRGLGRQVAGARHSWLADFGANIAGNAVFDGGVFLLSRIARAIR